MDMVPVHLPVLCGHGGRFPRAWARARVRYGYLSVPCHTRAAQMRHWKQGTAGTHSKHARHAGAKQCAQEKQSNVEPAGLPRHAADARPAEQSRGEASNQPPARETGKRARASTGQLEARPVRPSILLHPSMALQPLSWTWTGSGRTPQAPAGPTSSRSTGEPPAHQSPAQPSPAQHSTTTSASTTSSSVTTNGLAQSTAHLNSIHQTSWHCDPVPPTPLAGRRLVSTPYSYTPPLPAASLGRPLADTLASPSTGRPPLLLLLFPLPSARHRGCE